MRLPRTPPDKNDLLLSLDPARLVEIFQARVGPEADGRYLHWDEIRRRRPPEGLSFEEWWLGTRYARSAISRALPLMSANGEVFSYALPDAALELLHWIDQNAAGEIVMTEAVNDEASRQRYLVSSLIEESITSSQLEGAATTRKVAKEMLRSGRAPRDVSERMILNNYEAMSALSGLRNLPLTVDIVNDLQRMLTQGTLDDPSAAGRPQRLGEERVRVWSSDGTLLHTPPPASEIDDRLEAMCRFANGEIPEGFVHPVVRAIMLHLWLAYDHPYEDGNGRTARALFYWSMLRSGYWIVEFLSISTILRKAQAQYGRAFLYTETDSFDATYFLLHQLQVLKQAVEEVQAYLRRKMSEVRETTRLLRTTDLNHRQIALLGHALRHPDFEYTFASHATSHRVVFQSARTDLIDLTDRGYLQRVKRGKRYYFYPVSDLHERVRRSGDGTSATDSPG